MGAHKPSLNRATNPAPGLKAYLVEYEWWTAHNEDGGTTICVRTDKALSTQCSNVDQDLHGRHASDVTNGESSNLLITGAYLPSGNSPEALSSRCQMKAQL
eukprot:1157238-Pelagomonas_calceolata.AAC.2